MLQDIIFYTAGYLVLLYLVANSTIRVLLGRSCQASSWCLTSVLCLASLGYLAGELPLGQFYAAHAVPYVAAIAVAVPVFVSASLLLARRRRSAQS